MLLLGDRGDGGEGAEGGRRENLYRKWLMFDGVFRGACEDLEDPLSACRVTVQAVVHYFF